MSTPRFLPTEPNAVSETLISRYESAVPTARAISSSDTMDTYVSELPVSRNYFANSITRMLSSATTSRHGLLEAVYSTHFFDKTSNEKEFVYPKTEIKVLVIDKLINNDQQDVFNRMKEISSSCRFKTKLAKSPSNSRQKSFSLEKISKLLDQKQNRMNFLHAKLGIERTHKYSIEVGTKSPHSIAKVLKLELEKSPAIEAAIAFPDPTLLEQLSLEELAELEIDGPDDFCLFIVTKDDGCYFDLVYSFNSVLELAENFGWSPSIEVFTVTQAEEAGGLENLARSWSPLVHSIFHK